MELRELHQNEKKKKKEVKMKIRGKNGVKRDVRG